MNDPHAKPDGPAASESFTRRSKTTDTIQLRIWFGIVLLVVALAAISMVTLRKQSVMAVEAETARQLRIGRLALMDVDVAILDVIARRDQADL